METTHQVLNTNNNNNNQTLEISQVLTTPQSQDSGSPDDRISNHVYAFYILSKWLNVILITVITVTGLYGNTMSLRLFLRKFLNKKTQQKLTIYFLLLSLSDMLVLALHYVDFTFRSWVNLLDAHSSSEFNFVDKCLLCCKLLPYLRNVFRTVSVYTLLILTVQRFIVLYFPLVRSKFLSLRFNESLIVGLVMFALCLSMGNLFMNDLVPHKETQQNFCSVDERFVHVQFAVDVVFVSLTIIFPTLFIFIFSIILFLEIRRNLPDQSRAALVSIRSNSKTNSTNGNGTINGLTVKRANSGDMFTLDTSTEIRKELNRASGTIGNVGGCGSETNSRTGCMVTSPMLACHHHNGNSQQQAETIELKFKNKLNHTIRTTYMLVLLSKWFVIFHVPYFVCWAIYHIYVNQPTKTSTTTSDRSSPLLTPHYNMTSSMLSSSASSSSSSSSSSPFSNDLDPNTILTIRGFLNLFEILFLFNYTVHFFLYLFNIPSFKRAHANEVKRFLRKIGFCIKN